MAGDVETARWRVDSILFALVLLTFIGSLVWAAYAVRGADACRIACGPAAVQSVVMDAQCYCAGPDGIFVWSGE